MRRAMTGATYICDEKWQENGGAEKKLPAFIQTR